MSDAFADYYKDKDDLDRLDKGLSGVMAHLAKLFCIAFCCAVWPALVWYLLL